MAHVVPLLTLVSLAVADVVSGYPYLLGESKRQGLIPFPRVGRGPAYYSDLEDLDDVYLPEDVYLTRYTRSFFSPRLGRRKRSVSEESVQEDSSSSRSLPGQTRNGPFVDMNVQDLTRLLRTAPWTLLAFKGGIAKKTAFNPRLGRAMAPRLGKKRSDITDDLGVDDAEDSTQQDKRGGVASFSPRLGRSSSSHGHWSDDYESSAAVSDEEAGNELQRSLRGGVNSFSPRLGRSATSQFSPRLGRSDPHTATTQG